MLKLVINWYWVSNRNKNRIEIINEPNKKNISAWHNLVVKMQSNTIAKNGILTDVLLKFIEETKNLLVKYFGVHAAMLKTESGETDANSSFSYFTVNLK